MEAQASLPTIESTVRPATIMIVEDEGIVAMDMSFQLQDMGYLVCGIADNSEDAIALAQLHKPQLVLMDIVINGKVDGIDTAKHISRGLHIPVVFLTAYSDPSTVERAARTAPYGYLTKPFQAGELRAAIEVALYKSLIERQLRESEQWFSTTLRCVGDAVIATDPEARIRFMNPRAETLTGWSLDDVVGRDIDSVLRLVQTESGEPIESPGHRAVRENRVVDLQYGTQLVRRDGGRCPVDDTAAPIRADDGRMLGAVVVFRDFTERLRYEENLRRSEEQFRNAFDFAPAGMAMVSLDGGFLQVNGAMCALVGRSQTELYGMRRQDLSPEKDAKEEQEQLLRLLTGETPVVQFEKRYRQKTGDEILALVSVSLLRDQNEPACYLYQIHDRTGERAAQDQLEHLAHYDSLTGISNRARLRIEAERMLKVARRHHQHLAVVFLDLDRFKQVNDSLGHEAGDQVLQEVAKRLTSCLRSSDCVARFGGDEFTLLLGDLIHAEDVLLVTQKIEMALSKPFLLARDEVLVTASLGVSMYPGDGDELKTLFRRADSALYHAKREGRNNTQFYRPEQTARAEKQSKLVASLPGALERREFVLYYQPILSVGTAKPVGAEALIRWNHPENGLVAPDTFIPVAEQSGFIVDLGEWVIREACREAANWKKAGNPLTVSVNVAASQFTAGTLVEVVQAALEDAGLDPEWLCLEITEHQALYDTELNLAVVKRLKALGVHIAVDDFGVGYSSLSYLKRFAPSSLKIDRSFVRDVIDDHEDAAIVSAVIAMAKRLKIRSVAEGVENEAQRAFLAAEGCDEVQGYLFARPCPANTFHAWLRRHSGSAIVRPGDETGV